MRLKEFFHDKDYHDESIVRNASNFTPQAGRNTNLDTFISYMNRFPVGRNNRSKVRSNLNKKQRNSLKTLRNNNNILIKEADKGSAIIIMNKSYYRDKISTMLNDDKFYEKLPTNKDNDVLRKIRTLTNETMGLTPKEKAYLTVFESKTSQFYGLPKVHKSKLILEQIKLQNSDYITLKEPEDLKFRPIVAGPSCPTHRLSNLIDILLKPFITKVKSYVRDDLDFLNHIPQTVTDNSILCTFDVVSLYSNIPHDLGIEAISYWIDKYPENLMPRFDKEFILEGLKLILNNNTFEFNDNFFKLNLGCPMGSKCSPNYAILVLGYLEVKLYEEVEINFGTQLRNYIETNFRRYLDDIFLIWHPSFGNIEGFHNLLNSIHPNIQYTISLSDKSMPFLDILVIKDGENIITDIYHKPTDTKQYLNFHSCHPRHTKENIPFSLARRVCTIVTKPELRNKRLQELKNALLNRHYPEYLIDKGINRANRIDIRTLRTPKVKIPSDNIVTFVNTYNPNQTEFFNDIFKINKDFIFSDTHLNHVFKETEFINSKRQGPSLKRILTRAKFTDDQYSGNDGPMITKCNKVRCKLCDNIDVCSKTFFPETNKTFQIKTKMNCDSKFVIYHLTCMKCKASYIGETQDLRGRTNTHRSHSNNPPDNCLYVSQHIYQCAQDLDVKFKITPFYKLHNQNREFRLLKESYFINKYQPSLNK